MQQAKVLKERKAPKRINVAEQLSKTLNLIPKHFFSEGFHVISFLRESPFTVANYRDLMSQVLL